MKKNILIILCFTVLLCGCAYNYTSIRNHNTNMEYPHYNAHTIEITQENTGVFNEQRGFFLISPSTYRFKYGNYFQLYGEISYPQISFSGEKFATLSSGYLLFSGIKVLYPTDLKGWRYYDTTLHGYTLLPTDGQGNRQSVGLSYHYFFNDTNYVGSEKLFSISRIIGNGYNLCEDKNNDSGPGALVADTFTQTIENKNNIAFYTTYRGYNEGEMKDHNTLCFQYHNIFFNISVYNYSLQQSKLLFDSLEFNPGS